MTLCRAPSPIWLAPVLQRNGAIVFVENGAASVAGDERNVY
jgi:hypothetical protein